MESTKIFYASANIGVGFWTKICMLFADFFGKTSLRLLEKQNELAKRLVNNINKQASSSGYVDIVDISISFGGPLNATAIAVGKLNVSDNQEKETALTKNKFIETKDKVEKNYSTFIATSLNEKIDVQEEVLLDEFSKFVINYEYEHNIKYDENRLNLFKRGEKVILTSNDYSVPYRSVGLVMGYKGFGIDVLFSSKKGDSVVFVSSEDIALF